LAPLSYGKSGGSSQTTRNCWFGDGMSTSRVDAPPSAFARSVRVTDDQLIVELTDGRELSVPLSWYPRLNYGRPDERARWEIIGRGDGIHWPDLDEDISVEGLLAGRRSGERRESIERWLAALNESRKQRESRP
jgi:hypothetical protein